MRRLIWNFLSQIYPFFLRKRYRMNIEKNVIISYKARLDKSINPKGIHIGENTWVLANSVILAHDHLRKMKVNTYIGKNCLIGIDSIIMPGVVIGDHVVVGAGAIVTKDVKSNCIVAGNPAKVLKTGIKLNNKGQLIKENV